MPSQECPSVTRTRRHCDKTAKHNILKLFSRHSYTRLVSFLPYEKVGYGKKTLWMTHEACKAVKKRCQVYKKYKDVTHPSPTASKIFDFKIDFYNCIYWCYNCTIRHQLNTKICPDVPYQVVRTSGESIAHHHVPHVRRHQITLV